MKTLPFILCLLSLLPLPVLAQQPYMNTSCDRSCLEDYVDQYLDAMENQNVSSALFAPSVKFTENGVQLPLGGEGLWYQMSGRGNYDFYVPDVETRQVAFIGTVLEGEDQTLVAIALRLKIDDFDKISEVEQLAIRPAAGLFGGESNSPFPETGVAVEAMVEPHPIYRESIPASQRPSREELIRVANYYFEGLQRNDGQGYYPFSDDCDRYENGIRTTNNPQQDPDTGETIIRGCKQQFEESLRGVVSRVRDRRFVAVDRERGIVFAFGFFDHYNINWTWQLGELFKIEDGLIKRIEAVFHRAPFGINSGWSSFEQGMSEEIQSIR